MATLLGWQIVGLQKAALFAVPLVSSITIAYETRSLQGCTYQPGKSLPPRFIDQVVRALYTVGMGGVTEGCLEAVTSTLVGDEALRSMRLVSRAIFALFCACLWSGAEKDGRHFWPAAQRWRGWRLVERYFGTCRIALSTEWQALSAEDVLKWRTVPNMVVGLHPHGSLPLGGVLNGLTIAGGDMGNQCADKNSPTLLTTCRPEGEDVRIKTPSDKELHSRWWPHIQMRGASASFVFWIPIVRQMMLWLGLIDCSEPYVKTLLKEGKTVVLCPGGAAESAYSQPGVFKLYMKHKGFMRVALETRTPVISAYTFGDEALWWQYQHGPGRLDRVRAVIKRASGLMPPTWLHILPRRVPLTTVVGVPLDLSDLWPAQGQPVAQAAIDEAMKRYTKSIVSLFEANKGRVVGEYYKDAKMIVES